MKDRIKQAQEQIDKILSDLEQEMITDEYFPAAEKINDLNYLIEKKMNEILTEKNT